MQIGNYYIHSQFAKNKKEKHKTLIKNDNIYGTNSATHN